VNLATLLITTPAHRRQGCHSLAGGAGDLARTRPPDRRLAAALQGWASKPGDRVASCWPNSAPSWWATGPRFKAGAFASPINTMYKQDEIAYLFPAIPVMRVLIAEAQFFRDYLAWVETAAS